MYIRLYRVVSFIPLPICNGSLLTHSAVVRIPMQGNVPGKIILSCDIVRISYLVIPTAIDDRAISSDKLKDRPPLPYPPGGLPANHLADGNAVFWLGIR